MSGLRANVPRSPTAASRSKSPSGTHPHPARNAVATTSCRKPKGALRSAEASLCRAAPANPCQGVRVRIRNTVS